ncbi:MAG: lipid A export permease/ATP-binding protein MsbA [Gammaproteobacteria bacterium]|nr:lipid A export permease/ATP-binding protein MsbA [Gammaproteobacteria bacterium]
MALDDHEQPAVWRRLLARLKPYWAWFILAVLGLLLDSLAQSGFIYLLRPLIDEGFSAESAVGQWLPLAMFGLILMRVFGNFVGIYTTVWIGRKVVNRLRADLFGHYLLLPQRFFDQHSAGDLVSRVTYNTDQVAQAATNGMITAVRDSLTVLGLITVMLLQSLVLSLSLALLLPVVVLVVGVISRRFRRLSRRIQESMGDLTHVTEETVRGHQVVKMYAGEAYERQRFDAHSERNRQLHQRLIGTQLLSSSLVQLFAGLALLLLLYLATQKSFDLDISAGVFISVLGAMVAMIAPMKRLTNVHAQLQKALAAADSVFAVIDLASEDEEQAQALRSRIPAERTVAEPPARSSGRIELRQVGFRYPQREHAALEQVSLQLQPGTVTALVGRSGSGKTTLASMLARFHLPDQGEILLDGIPLQDWSLPHLRRQIAYVGQDVVLFNDTLYNNIAYGGMADATRDQVLAAIAAAHVDEFASRLPQGLDTPIGDRGHLLSGGQRQRLALARALLKDAPILILDEATSSLDNVSQQYIQDALQLLQTDRTVLIIAHRLQTIEHADSIVLLEAGRVLAQGRHATLLDECPAYQRLQQQAVSETDSGCVDSES